MKADQKSFDYNLSCPIFPCPQKYLLFGRSSVKTFFVEVPSHIENLTLCPFNVCVSKIGMIIATQFIGNVLKVRVQFPNGKAKCCCDSVAEVERL